ncbi:1-phosphatidylinositol 4,5-bisphosphate phosphodiesterase delta-4 [Amblyraja radiata]|uniref:1-phosphatidylinositol 4,5-bisphosphate phosphodiesterase delta-4 n=1 Tax=Amblyraja radiata TaxID=386614 RepID=UPI0014031515|nr:1-phosphatidylinositol 4,5-bisphosphate phosphodiesterase delta-4 [Amblyraja radiata]XP_032880828.1 1-phosphatidylinositol 4,5-bisphosphate phosphodiesterase delta-4 [Amblyraja radiata]
MASPRHNSRLPACGEVDGDGDGDVRAMQQGATLHKVRSSHWKRPRFFQLQEDGRNIWYRSHKPGQHRSSFSISEVEAVREGHQSEILQSIADQFPADRCFTLVFRGRRGNLDLVAESGREAGHWVRGLRKLIEADRNMDQREKLDHWISDWFQKADKDKDGRMNFKEVRELLKMMNVNMNEDHSLRLFKMADKSQSSTLEGEEFVLFYKALTKRDDVQELFTHLSADGETLTLEEFAGFLQSEQGEPREEAETNAKDLITRYEPSETARRLYALTLDGFLMYLCSPEGSIFELRHGPVYQDMSQPLCHYFISSSHNTYLLEDQLRGHSSVEGYIRALKKGCRCVEVDTWDGPHQEPVVYHGHTLTSKILFKDVIAAVNTYAFTVSEFPVIVSIENHCRLEQQQVMAHHLRSILGDKLLTCPLEGSPPNALPSPQDLRRKVLVKGKRIGWLEGSGQALDEGSEEEEEVGETEEENGRNGTRRRGKIHSSKQQLSRELSDCVVYCKTVPFHSFKHSRAHYKFYEISSFTESKARKLVREYGGEFVRHNTWQLSRVYPSGLRTDSSNFHPQDMWNSGCQIVALNFQSAGEEMDLNDGRFSPNGHCGYLLKPVFMRSPSGTFHPDRPQTSTAYRPLNLTIQVISGQQLPKVTNSKPGWIVDPLVRVEIHGVAMDNAKLETKYIDNNGFNPVWGETLRFTVHVPDLALVRFLVEDYDLASKNDFVGQFTLPLTSMKEGYRHVPLLSQDGTPLTPASLFVHVTMLPPADT